jgi:hypothetical protein
LTRTREGVGQGPKTFFSGLLEVASYLSKMLFFQSTALVFGRGLEAAFFGVAVGVDGSTATGLVGRGTTADAGPAAVAGAEAATGAGLDVAAMLAAPSPTTTNGAQ